MAEQHIVTEADMEGIVNTCYDCGRDENVYEIEEGVYICRMHLEKEYSDAAQELYEQIISDQYGSVEDIEHEVCDMTFHPHSDCDGRLVGVICDSPHQGEHFFSVDELTVVNLTNEINAHKSALRSNPDSFWLMGEIVRKSTTRDQLKTRIKETKENGNAV